MRLLSTALLLGLLVPVLAACGAEATPTTAPPQATNTTAAAAATPTTGQAASGATIRVGSKDFAEEFILGNMYALVLENAGFTVERKLNLGGTPVCQAALLSGDLDVYPEYTGTGLLTVLKQPPMTDAQAVYDAVKKGYEEQFKLTWLDQAPMNDTQALAMTKAKSDELGITNISQLVAKANQLTMVGPPEFQEREDGIPALKKVYGDFQLKEYKAVDPGLRYPSLLSGDADVTVAFSTDGEIAANNLVVLQDDKHFWPPYHVAPVIRQEVLDANPGIATALNALAPKITDEVMSKLNYEVTGNKREPADVAKEFLQQEGLIK